KHGQIRVIRSLFDQVLHLVENGVDPRCELVRIVLLLVLTPLDLQLGDDISENTFLDQSLVGQRLQIAQGLQAALAGMIEAGQNMEPLLFPVDQLIKLLYLLFDRLVEPAADADSRLADAIVVLGLAGPGAHENERGERVEDLDLPSELDAVGISIEPDIHEHDPDSSLVGREHGAIARRRLDNFVTVPGQEAGERFSGEGLVFDEEKLSRYFWILHIERDGHEIPPVISALLRKTDGEGGAVAGAVAENLDAPLMILLDQGPAEKEPQAYAVLPRREEGPEELLSRLVRDALAKVGDSGFDMVQMIPGLDDQPSTDSRSGDGVEDQVHQDLLDLVLVHEDRSRIEALLQPDPVLAQRAAEELESMDHDLVEVSFLLFGPKALLREALQSSRQIVKSLQLRLDGGELFQIVILGFEIRLLRDVLHEVEEREAHAVQGVLGFVDERCGDLADRDGIGREMKILLRLCELKPGIVEQAVVVDCDGRLGCNGGKKVQMLFAERCFVVVVLHHQGADHLVADQHRNPQPDRRWAAHEAGLPFGKESLQGLSRCEQRLACPADIGGEAFVEPGNDRFARVVLVPEVGVIEAARIRVIQAEEEIACRDDGAGLF